MKITNFSQNTDMIIKIQPFHIYSVWTTAVKNMYNIVKNEIHDPAIQLATTQESRNVCAKIITDLRLQMAEKWVK